MGLPTRLTATLAALFSALASAFMVTGCTGLPELDLNPFVRVAHLPDGVVEIEALGPFVDIHSGPEGLSHAVRPFYQHKAFGDDSLTDVFAPFYRHRRSDSGTRWKIWPLVYSDSRIDGPDGPEWDAALIPFLWMGSGPQDGDGYFAFWPLAGRLRNLFGLETYDFLLWPFFMRTRMDISEPSTSWTVMLLGGWTTGGPRDGSWRLLPFYRHRLQRNAEGELVVDQHSAPWPFYTWGYDHLDSETPSDRKGLWPLWSHESSDAWTKTTVLWPFFRYNRERVVDDPDFLYHLPWPFFQSSRTGTSERFTLFPLYSRFDSETLSSRAFLTVFVRDMRWPGLDAEPEQRVTDVFPFWHSWWAQRHAGRVTNEQAWPLYHRETEPGGREDFALPSFVPGRHVDVLQPVDESWTPIFALWSKRTDGETTDRRYAFDLVQWRTGPEGTRISVPFFYSRRPDGDGHHRDAWLWGAVTTRDNADGLSSVSLLGFDLWQR